jgi:hypothetical protein
MGQTAFQCKVRLTGAFMMATDLLLSRSSYQVPGTRNTALRCIAVHETHHARRDRGVRTFTTVHVQGDFLSSDAVKFV